MEQPSHISDGLLFGVVQIRSSMIGVKVDETLVANGVVFRPRHRAVSVPVELRESFLRVLQRVLPVDVLDPHGQLLCGSHT